MKIKLSKKIIIPAVSVLVAGALAVVFVPKIIEGAKPKAPEVSATPLAKMDLENTVSVTGTVKSENATNVYSTLSYQIKQVNVKVGDTVHEGDVLCELDVTDLLTQIEQQTATLDKNQADAQHNLAVTQNQLDTERFNQDYKYDNTINNAERAVEDAEKRLITAQDTLIDRENALNNAELSLRDARGTLNIRRKEFGDYRDTNDIDSKDTDDVEYARNLEAVRAAERNLERSEQAVEDAKRGVEDAKRGIADAKEAIRNAKEDLNTVTVLKEETLISKQDSVNSARLGSDLSDKWLQVENLKKDLDKAIIVAPSSGTVTAVLATEGASGQGLLFVIEDTQKLKVDTKIKEYDISAVNTGQKVKIKSDGTGDSEYTGKVSKIAPTAVKDAKGDTVETTDVEFVTEIGVTGINELKIGMNARLEIITEEKKNIFAVPYDAVVQDENGDSVVFVARPSGIPGERAEQNDGERPTPVSMPDMNHDYGDDTDGSGQKVEKVKKDITQNGMIAVSIPVNTGMETDFYIEIESDELREGDLIISDPSELRDGDAITLGGDMAFGGGRPAGGGQGGPGGGPRGGIRIG